MNILLIIGLSVVGIYVIALVFAAIAGSCCAKNIIKHAGWFKCAFDKEFEKTASKEIALTNAFRVLNTCPILKELTPVETSIAISIFQKAKQPQIVIYNILFFTPSKNLIGIFKNTSILEKIVEKSNAESYSTGVPFQTNICKNSPSQAEK